MSVKKSVQAAKSLTVVGISSLLFLTACATSSTAPVENTVPSVSASADAASQATPSFAPATLTPEQKQNMTPEEIADYEKMSKMTPEELAAFEEANHGAFSSRLVADPTVKAGSNLRVTGGTYKPGVSVKIYVAQLMAMPSYDAENDMYHQVGEQVHLTDTVTAVTDEKGQFDVKVLIPASVTPQQVDVISETPDGNGDLVRIEVQ